MTLWLPSVFRRNPGAGRAVSLMAVLCLAIVAAFAIPWYTADEMPPPVAEEALGAPRIYEFRRDNAGTWVAPRDEVTFSRTSTGLRIRSDASSYHYQFITPDMQVQPGDRYRISVTTAIISNGMSIGVLDPVQDRWIVTAPLRDGAQILDFVPPSDRVRLIISNNNSRPAVSVAELRALSVAPRPRSSSAGIELGRSQSLWGSVRVLSDRVVEQVADATFPSVLRLPGARPETGAWSFEITATNLLPEDTPASRGAIVDIGIELDEGRIQAWWGGPLAGGIRLTERGRVVAASSAAALSRRTARIGLRRHADGFLEMLLDGRPVVGAEVTLAAQPGTIDLATRNSPVRWSDLSATNLIDDAPPRLEWLPRPGEPAWNAGEGVTFGYQPSPSHLWNRWLGSFVPSPPEMPGLPSIGGGGPSALTHGPLVGRPSAGTIGIMIRTRNPTSVELLVGTDPDPRRWDIAARFTTRAEDGNTGHALLTRDALRTDEANYTFRLDGRVVDLRDKGQWPVLKRRWFELETAEAVELAIFHCDNLSPVAVSPLPDQWLTRARNVDLQIHMGDAVYEQSYRRRPEVSRLDYFTNFAPGTAPARRARVAPLIGVFDDHEFANDITGTGDVRLFAADPGPGIRHTDDLPWRISSRDVGRRVWEEWIGWGTPVDPRVKASAVTGRARIDRGGLRAIRTDPGTALANLDPATLAPLIVWPDGGPVPRGDIRPSSAGVYNIRRIDPATSAIDLDPRPPGEGEVSFSFSTPRFSSVTMGPVEILLLDTRTARSLWSLDPDAQGPTMLGKVQRDWLLDRIQTSTAKVLMLVSSVTMTFHNGFSDSKRDSWTGYRAERNLILDALKRRSGTKLIVSGDIHNAAARKLEDGLYEFIGGAWSDPGVCDVDGAVEPLPQFPNAQMLWVGEQRKPACDWSAYTSFMKIESSGEVAVEFMNLGTGAIVHRTQIPARSTP